MTVNGRRMPLLCQCMKLEVFILEGYFKNCYFPPVVLRRCVSTEPVFREAAVQQQEKVTKLIGWFVKAALRHAEAMEALEDELALAEVQDLNRYYHALRREGGMERFLELLDHQDPAVAGMAAVYAMRQAPPRCRAVLVRISRLPGLIGFRAKAALERWERGEWPE